MACSNAQVSPLAVPYSNVTLQGNIVALQRGLQLDLGNPPQTLSFQPSLIDDALAITDPTHCVDGNANTTCAARWGGLYESNASSTYYPVSEQSWNGSHITPDGRQSTTWFNDELRFAGQSIFGYPVTQYNPDIYSNIVGINENSSFLSIVVSSGLAPTKAFGLWAGSSAPNNEVDGSLVLGGYDKARVSGDFATFNATNSCLACPYVKSISYNAPDGTTTDLTDGQDTPLEVSLSPEILDMEVPPTVFDKFVQVTNAESAPDLHKFVWPVGTALGNITVSFYNGHSVTVRGDELWQPFTGYDNSGAFTVLNDSITISRLVNRTDGLTPNFGFPFFASTYMTFHPEEKYFALAEPVRDANVKSSIVSFCKSNGQSNNETSSSNTSSVSSSSSHAGAIAGGVVGGVAGLAIIGVLIWWFLRRRNKKRAAAAPATMNGSKDADEKANNVYPKDGSPMAFPTSAAPSELPQYTAQRAPTEIEGTTIRPELADTPPPAVRHEMPS